MHMAQRRGGECHERPSCSSRSHTPCHSLSCGPYLKHILIKKAQDHHLACFSQAHVRRWPLNPNLQLLPGCKSTGHEPAVSLQRDFAAAWRDGAARKKRLGNGWACAAGPAATFSPTLLPSKATTHSWRPTSAPCRQQPAVKQPSAKRVLGKSATAAKFCWVFPINQHLLVGQPEKEIRDSLVPGDWNGHEIAEIFSRGWFRLRPHKSLSPTHTSSIGNHP